MARDGGQLRGHSSGSSGGLGGGAWSEEGGAGCGMQRAPGGRPALFKAREAPARAARRQGGSAVWAAAVGLGAFFSAVLVQYLRIPSVAHDAQWDTVFGAPTEQFCARHSRPLVCAHGGDSAHHPPNTMAAFAAAVSGGSDCLEVDVAGTRDGVLVVLHRRELEKMVRREGVSVGDFTFREISQLDAGNGQRVPRAEHVLRKFSPHVQTLIVDIKVDGRGVLGAPKSMGTAALELAGATGCKNCVLWAKSDDEIRHIQSQDPSQAVGFVVMNETSLDRLEGRDRLDRLAGAANVAMHHETASASTLEEVRASGRRVFGWTANTPSMMRKLLDEAPVGGIVTNYPRPLLRAIDARMRACLAEREN